MSQGHSGVASGDTTVASPVKPPTAWSKELAEEVEKHYIPVTSFTAGARTLRRFKDAKIGVLDLYGVVHTAGLCGGVRAFPSPIPIVASFIGRISGSGFKQCQACKEAMAASETNKSLCKDSVELADLSETAGHPG